MVDRNLVTQPFLYMRYPGGKSCPGAYQRIINLIPPHETYVEPFLGAGAIYRFKRPSAHSILIDVDPVVVSDFAGSLRDKTVIVAADALPCLSLLTADKDTFIYCDPPYHPDTLLSKSRYRFSMDAGTHRRFLEISIRARSSMLISGYDCPIYSSMLQSWARIDYNQITRSGRIAIESLWYNYPTPDRLHDYSYAGQNFTDRQRIKRKISRLLSKLERTPAIERNAILSSMRYRFFSKAPLQLSHTTTVPPVR